MLEGICLFALLGLGLATVSAYPFSTLQSIEPLSRARGWNELVKGVGIFNDSFNTIQSKSNNAAAGVLDEFKLLLSQDNKLEAAYHNYRTLFKEEYDSGSGNIESFKEKLVGIAEHNLEANSGVHRWWMGVNQFTDLTSAELRGVIGDKKYDLVNANSSAHAYVSDSDSGVATPASFNSVADGWVPPVRNRHGPAYGEEFAVVAVIEVSYARRGQRKAGRSLSVQEMIDCHPAWCSETPKFCVGTPINKLFMYPTRTGLSGDNFHRYNNPPAKGTCPSPTGPLVIMGSPTVTKGGSEEELKQLLVDYGSAVVGLYFSDSLLNGYGGGVYPGSECGSSAPNQVLTLVGYGSYGGEDYWLLKNSLGQNWGEQGYLRLARNGGNVCGILGPAYTAAST